MPDAPPPDTWPDPGPDLPPVEVPPQPPGPTRPETPPERPIPDLPEERPPSGRAALRIWAAWLAPMPWVAFSHAAWALQGTAPTLEMA